VEADDGRRTTNFPATLVEPLGSAQIVHLTLPDKEKFVVSTSGQSPVRQARARAVRIPPRAAHLFQAANGWRIA
jgi:ABC-type sugar transport system ATPase subunit